MIDTNKRSFKKAIIVIVYIILFFLLGYFIYSLVKTKPTCFDKIKNQNEEEIDCGGTCAACAKAPEVVPIAVKEKAFVYGGQGKFDVMARISNPNSKFGADKFDYKFVLKGTSGSVLAERSGTDFILPAGSKYIVETNLETSEQPVGVEFSVSNSEWQEFSGYEEPQLNIYNKRYDLISSGVGFSKVYALMRNGSPFDFNLVKIKIVLRDEEEKPVAFNSTEMRTILSNEQRDFTLIWPTSFPGDVQSIDVEAQANVFDSQNFIKTYAPSTQKFQRF
jgi:hypothetical protein